MKWYAEKGDMNDVVVSSGIRLSRNADAFPFPSMLNAEGRKNITDRVRSVLFNDENCSLSYIDMSSLSKYQSISLAERRLISPEFVSGPEGRGLILSADESTSVMLCDEDHITIQVTKAGLSLEETYASANAIDTLLDSNIKFAFDDKLGYLTASPSNLGTAMRAFAVLHLPALTTGGQINHFASTISHLGLNITPAYGNRSHPIGDLYRISNRITLGISEETAITNLKSIILQLSAKERAMAPEQMKSPEIQDKIYRAMGILRSARLLSSSEYMELISSVRLGAREGIFDIPPEQLDELTVKIQPATLSAAVPDISSILQRDMIRAEMVREALN